MRRIDLIVKMQIDFRIKQVFTSREKEIASLLIEGYNNYQIADLLFLSHHTVKSHRASLMSKLKARNALHLGYLLHNLSFEGLGE